MKIRRTAMLAGVLFSVLGFLQTAQAQGVSNRLETLFGQAVAADGEKYIALRNEILADKDASSFLSAKATDTNLLPRVIARVMLSWGENPATNTFYNEAHVKSIGCMLSSALPPLKEIRYSLSSYAAPDEFGYYEEPRQIKDTSEMMVLLEITLKGVTYNKKGEYQRMPEYEPWVRCLAVGLVEPCEDPDVVPVISEVLTKSTSYPLRLCSVMGLRRAKSFDTVEPLIGILSDENENIRGSAQRGLKDLTGQDFGFDQAKYREWWNQNKDRLLKKPPTQ